MKLRIFFGLLSCLILPFTAEGSALRQGGKLYAQEKYGEALSQYKNALEKNPNNAQAHFGAGASAYHLKEYQQAAQDFENVVKNSDKLRQDALFNLGNTYYRAGDKEAAIASYKKAILQNPQDKEAIHNLQLLLREQKANNQCNKNDPNQNQNSQNQDQKDQEKNQGQSPQQQQEKEKQQQQPQQQQQNQMAQQAANRVMQLARDNEYKRPTQPGQAAQDDTVEKDW